METKLKYEMFIKGRRAIIGSKFFYKGETEAIIESIEIDSEGWAIIFIANSSLEGIIENEIEETFFWEKKIIYQLPDTDGNLSEVKVGQEVYLTEVETNDIYAGSVVSVDNNTFCIRWKKELITSWVKNGNNLTNSGLFKVATNKPHRDFSDCMDWSHAPKEAIEWRVTVDGYAFWYSNAYCERSGLDYDYDCGMYYISAGYRADLLNENGVVEDWEYSLVKRPEEK